MEDNSVEQVSGWQPIYTAPRDGTKIDVWGINHLGWDKPGSRVVDVCWGDCTDIFGRTHGGWKTGRGESFEVTHWMHQPEPPNRDEVEAFLRREKPKWA